MTNHEAPQILTTHVETATERLEDQPLLTIDPSQISVDGLRHPIRYLQARRRVGQFNNAINDLNETATKKPDRIEIEEE